MDKLCGNDVSSDVKKRAILLSVCGASTFKLIRSLIDPDKLNSAPYKDLVAKVKEHYDPKPSSIVQRHKFNKRMRQPSESIAKYVAALRQLAEHCDHLNEMLRDKLVCDVNHEAIQQKLMAQNPAELTFAKAIELAQRIEIAQQDARRVTPGNGSSPNADTPKQQDVYKMHSYRRRNKKEPHGQPSPVSYHRCGGPHLAPACKFKEAMCYACKKRGHIARVCRSKSFYKGQKPTKGTHHLQGEEELEDSADDETYTLFTVKEAGSESIFQEVLINTIPVKMEVDTGASVSVLTHSTYQKIRECTHTQPLQPSVAKLKTYTGEVIPVLGQVPLKVSCGQKDYQLIAQVVKSSGPDLLGRNWPRSRLRDCTP